MTQHDWQYIDGGGDLIHLWCHKCGTLALRYRYVARTFLYYQVGKDQPIPGNNDEDNEEPPCAPSHCHQTGNAQRSHTGTGKRGFAFRPHSRLRLRVR
jgi:hypothetical protein